MRADDEEADSYIANKLGDRGYPGLGFGRKITGQPGINAEQFMKAGDEMNGVDEAKALEMVNEPAIWIERVKPDAVTYEVRNIPNDQALRVISVVLPKAIELYLKKSKDYGGNVMDRFELGEKAAIPDMARKFGKLIDAIWRDQPLQFEQPDEILMDLLGHIVIILDQRRKDKHADVLYHVKEES